MGLEIISGVERRRRWSVADKLRIVGEADEPGATVAEVARRHEISRSILWAWRRQSRAGELTTSDPLGFLPVVVDTASAVDAPIAVSNTPPAASVPADTPPPPGAPAITIVDVELR
jgi:transposase